MKFVISLIAGAIVGGVLFLALLYYNPFAGRQTVSPLALSEQELIDLTFSAVPDEAIAYTNDGESSIQPHPGKIAELWEPAIEKTRILVTVLADVRGEPLGVGVKFSSDSEKTRLLNSEALVASVWHVYLPGSGTFFIDETENLWSYLRNIVIPARWNSADSWRGSWFGITTVGPGALGTARLTGGSGKYADVTTEAVESWSAKAYSALQGPVAMTGSLTIAVSDHAPQ